MDKRLLAACAFTIAALTSAVHAQGFPDRLIRIIVPFTPGGSNDIVARELAAGFQDRFKQSAVVGTARAVAAPSPIPGSLSRCPTATPC